MAEFTQKTEASQPQLRRRNEILNDCTSETVDRWITPELCNLKQALLNDTIRQCQAASLCQQLAPLHARRQGSSLVIVWCKNLSEHIPTLSSVILTHVFQENVMILHHVKLQDRGAGTGSRHP